MIWASAGFVAPREVAEVEPLKEKRSHSSRAGSAWGDLRAAANFFTFTTGVLDLDLDLAAGEEVVGDELRARFLPLLRGITGEALYGWACLVSHRMRSLGLMSWSSPCWGAPIRSFHFNLLAGVTEVLAVSG